MGSLPRIAKVHPADDLPTHGDQILQQVASGHIAIMESGKKQIAVILDYIDFCVIIAAMQYCFSPGDNNPGKSSFESNLVRYKRTLGRYLAGEIDLETAADMLGLTWVDLLQRLSLFGIPVQEGSFDLDDSIEELRALRYLNFENWV